MTRAVVKCPNCASAYRVRASFPGWFDCRCGANVFWRDVAATAQALPQLTREEKLRHFYAWMDELNAEAVRRGLGDQWPLPERVAHSENCWLQDFENGLTPEEALDLAGPKP